MERSGRSGDVIRVGLRCSCIPLAHTMTMVTDSARLEEATNTELLMF